MMVTETSSLENLLKRAKELLKNETPKLEDMVTLIEEIKTALGIQDIIPLRKYPQELSTELLTKCKLETCVLMLESEIVPPAETKMEPVEEASE